MDLTRTLIIGNSGSGKSWLAERMAGQLQVPWVYLDSIHWLSDRHSIARPRSQALGLARIAADEERWVIEGVYGWIVSEILHRATALIWLCIDDVDCVANIRRREAKDDERLVAMLEWASNYRTRDDSSGFAAHQRIFDDFGASKIRLTNRIEITDFASEAGILPIG
ncbi:adenylate kinase [Pseudomonas jessenii]|uniref:adenylate kinase n=1 Tax=Pseudomonas jessenii TaxID=77298 RepID=UPI0030BD7E9B